MSKPYTPEQQRESDAQAIGFLIAENDRLRAGNAALLAALRVAEKYCPVAVQDYARAAIAQAEGQS